MNGSIRKLHGVVIGCLLLLVLGLPNPAVASSGALEHHSSFAQSAMRWMSTAVSLFLTNGADLVAGWDPWGETTAEPSTDLGWGLDPWG